MYCMFTCRYACMYIYICILCRFITLLILDVTGVSEVLLVSIVSEGS